MTACCVKSGISYVSIKSITVLNLLLLLLLSLVSTAVGTKPPFQSGTNFSGLFFFYIFFNNLNERKSVMKGNFSTYCYM